MPPPRRCCARRSTSCGRCASAVSRLLFLGLESGDDATLAAIHKGVTVAEQVEACRRAREAGIALSITTILGLAGADDPDTEVLSPASERHARATGAALSAIAPEFIGVLSLMVTPGTPMAERVASGEFIVAGPLAMLRELRELIAAIDVPDALFRSNHASNYLPVGGDCRRTRRGCWPRWTRC